MLKALKMRPMHDCSTCQKRSEGMFCNFRPDTLQHFSSLGRLVSYPAGAVLIREDAPCDQVRVICSGQVKLSCTSREGRTLNLKIALPGEVLGLGAAISGTNFEVTAETLIPTVVKVVRRDEFLGFLHRNGEASLSASRSLAAEYRSAFAGARNLGLSATVASRVAKLLLDLARGGVGGKVTPHFQMTLTHDDLAEFTSTTRETVTRTLGQFKKEKLIHIQGAAVEILAPEKLAALVA